MVVGGSDHVDDLDGLLCRPVLALAGPGVAGAADLDDLGRAGEGPGRATQSGTPRPHRSLTIDPQRAPARVGSSGGRMSHRDFS